MQNVENSIRSATDINYRTSQPSKSDAKADVAPKAQAAEDVVEPKPAARKWLSWSNVDMAVSGVVAALNAAVGTQHARRAYNCPCNRQFNTVLAGAYLGVAGIWTATTMLKHSRIVREQRLATQPQ